MSTIAMQVSGLDLDFDEDNDQFIMGDQVMCQNCYRVTLDEMVPTLLNKSLRYPQYVYTFHEKVVHQDHMHSSVWQDNLRYDIFHLPSGLLGIEYNKTHIFYTEGDSTKAACILEVIAGEVTVVMQKNQAKDIYDFDTNVVEGITFIVQAGERVTIPTGYMFTFSNTTNTTVIFSVVWTDVHELDYSVINREQGLAYFYISKNAKVQLVTNPRYRTVPAIREYSLDQVERIISNSVKVHTDPIYNVALNNIDLLLDTLYA